MKCPHLTDHAIRQFTARAEQLGLTTNLDWLQMAIDRSCRERVRRSNPITRLHILMRDMKHGRCERRIYKGWRFVIDEDAVVRTVERIRPRENYIGDRFQFAPPASGDARSHCC
jgi:predicted P-loop ATPase/GTPase